MSTPQAWPPYAAGRDCSLGFCSVYCPQWCYFYFPSPPPPFHSTFSLSPLLIAIIVVITTAFFIAAGYLVALKYCSNRRRRRPSTSSPPSSWLPPPATGLDSSLINKLTIHRYRRGDNNIPIANGDHDCSVCLGEFRDGDSLRLLPKCSHAFHKGCIDTWLSSHSNCPLCRASVIGPVEYLIEESEEEEGEFVDEVVAVHDLEEERQLSEERRRDGNHEDDDVVIEIREEGYEIRMAGESSAGRSSVSVKRSPSPSSRGSSGVDSL